MTNLKIFSCNILQILTHISNFQPGVSEVLLIPSPNSLAQNCFQQPCLFLLTSLCCYMAPSVTLGTTFSLSLLAIPIQSTKTRRVSQLPVVVPSSFPVQAISITSTIQ